MSIGEMAKHLGVSRSTLYYQMKKFGIERRSRSEAQQLHISTQGHQRVGKKHSSTTRAKISNRAKEFWDSESGERNRDKLRELRQAEWNKRSKKEKKRVIERLQAADKPSPGELSRFGRCLAEFLSENERLKTGIQLTSDHISDIILEERGVVVELVLPFDVYGEEQEQKFVTRYDRLTNELNDLGYRVVIIQDRSNTLSRARCQRVYDELLAFFQDDSLQQLILVS
jgi:DNA-binding transcriptional MerR regulator